MSSRYKANFKWIRYVLFGDGQVCFSWWARFMCGSDRIKDRRRLKRWLSSLAAGGNLGNSGLNKTSFFFGFKLGMKTNFLLSAWMVGSGGTARTLFCINILVPTIVTDMGSFYISSMNRDWQYCHFCFWSALLQLGWRQLKLHHLVTGQWSHKIKFVHPNDEL